MALFANNLPYLTSQAANPDPSSARTLINNHGAPMPNPSTHSFPAYNPTTYNECVTSSCGNTLFVNLQKTQRIGTNRTRGVPGRDVFKSVPDHKTGHTRREGKVVWGGEGVGTRLWFTFCVVRES